MSRSLLQMFYHAMAELEAHSAYPRLAESPLRWRRRELASRGVVFGRQLSAGHGLFILHGNRIRLGERVVLGIQTKLMDFDWIEIGDDFIAATDLVITGGTHDPVTLVPSSRPIRIGCRVWCGVRVTILGGVTIGNDVVIGAGSVVTKDVPDNTVVAGVPARVLRTIDRANTKVWSTFGRPLAHADLD